MIDMVPLAVFFASFCLSAICGLAALLRADKELTKRSVFTAVLNMGLLGLGCSLLWWSKFSDNVPYLLGANVILGLCGQPMLDVILGALSRFVISILTKDKEEKK